MGLAFYSSYSTALVFDAASQLYPLLKGMSPLSSFASPYAVLEVFSYGLAMSRSGILVYKKNRHGNNLLFILLLRVE